MKSTSSSSPNKSFTVNRDNTLLNYLYEVMAHTSKTTVKSLLYHKQVYINGRAVTQFDAPLKPGDRVEIFVDRKSVPFRHPMLKIIFEDESLIVVEKSSGLLSMATDRNKEKTAYHILNDYIRKSNPHGHVYILHRLDRETSGIMMFAKNQKVQETLQRNWDEMILERKYVAVVEGEPAKPSGTIESYMTEGNSFVVHSSGNAETGKLAITHYRTIQAGRNYSLVELELTTGRKNQIRVHMQEAGHPVAGDKKYGARTNPIRRLALHAFKLRFIHPVTQQEMNFETPIPRSFASLRSE